VLGASVEERAGTLIERGWSGKAPSRAGEIVVVTHIDVIPTFLDQARPLILDFVTDSAKDPGVKEFILVSWLDITNHFQLIERFQNMRAFNAHVSATTPYNSATAYNHQSAHLTTSDSIGLTSLA